MILIHFVRNRSRMKNIFTLGHFELYLTKVSGVIFAPKPFGLGVGIEKENDKGGYLNSFTCY
jgi:hypothetical protein